MVMARTQTALPFSLFRPGWFISLIHLARTAAYVPPPSSTNKAMGRRHRLFAQFLHAQQQRLVIPTFSINENCWAAIRIVFALLLI